MSSSIAEAIRKIGGGSVAKNHLRSRAKVVVSAVDFPFLEIGNVHPEAVQEISPVREGMDVDVATLQKRIQKRLTEASCILESASRRMAPMSVNSGPLFERLALLMRLNGEPGEDVGEQFETLAAQFGDSVRLAQSSMKKRDGHEEAEQQQSVTTRFKGAIRQVELCREDYCAMAG